MVDLCLVAPKRFWEMNGKWCFVWKNWFIHEFMNRFLICVFITWHSLPSICGGIVAWQWRLHLSLRRCCSYYLVVCGHAICWHNWTVYTLEDNVEPTNHPFRKENDQNQTSRELCSMLIFRGVITSQSWNHEWKSGWTPAPGVGNWVLMLFHRTRRWSDIHPRKDGHVPLKKKGPFWNEISSFNHQFSANTVC